MNTFALKMMNFALKMMHFVAGFSYGALFALAVAQMQPPPLLFAALVSISGVSYKNEGSSIENDASAMILQ